MSKAIEDKILEILRTNLNLGTDTILPKDLLVEDLSADSLDLVELVMAAEEEFGVVIPDSDVENIVSVKECIDYITTKVDESTPKIGTHFGEGITYKKVHRTTTTFIEEPKDQTVRYLEYIAYLEKELCEHYIGNSIEHIQKQTTKLLRKREELLDE